MAAEQTRRTDRLRSYADAPECLESSISADIHGGTACHNPCRGRRRLDDLALDDRLFVIRIDRTEPMIAIGNEDLAMDRVPDEQERGYRLSRCDFFRSRFTCELLRPNSERPEALKMSLALYSETGSCRSLRTYVRAWGLR